LNPEVASLQILNVLVIARSVSDEAISNATDDLKVIEFNIATLRAKINGNR